MLNHLIERLEARRRGPDVLSRAAAAARHSSERAKPKNAVKQLGKVVVNATVRTTTKAGKAITGGADDDDDDGDYDEDMAAVEDGTWDTDATYDLLEQTRSLLILADRQGLDLFGDSGVAATEAATRAAKAKAKSRAGRFPSISVVKSNDSSDVFQSSDMTGNKLLKRLAAVVQSLVTTDCVYITQRFRLLKPPYALQTLVLDIAALVYHKGDLDIKVLMMGAVIESLYTMGAPVHERLCQWLEGRMGELLRTLAAERHPDDHNGSKVEFGGELWVLVLS
jgi:16S rRNA G966 N2-methylase RsmD